MRILRLKEKHSKGQRKEIFKGNIHRLSLYFRLVDSISPSSIPLECVWSFGGFGDSAVAPDGGLVVGRGRHFPESL